MCLVNGNICNALTEIEFELISDCRRHGKNRVRLRRKVVKTTTDRLPDAAGNFKRPIQRSGGPDGSFRDQIAHNAIDKQRIPISGGAEFRDQRLVRRSPALNSTNFVNLGFAQATDGIERASRLSSPICLLRPGERRTSKSR